MLTNIFRRGVFSHFYGKWFLSAKDGHYFILGEDADAKAITFSHQVCYNSWVNDSLRRLLERGLKFYQEKHCRNPQINLLPHS